MTLTSVVPVQVQALSSQSTSTLPVHAHHFLSVSFSLLFLRKKKDEQCSLLPSGSISHTLLPISVQNAGSYQPFLKKCSYVACLCSAHRTILLVGVESDTHNIGSSDLVVQLMICVGTPNIHFSNSLIVDQYMSYILDVKEYISYFLFALHVLEIIRTDLAIDLQEK